MKILLLSAYDAQSHRYWRQGLTSYFADVDWQVLTLPPRHFSWRVRGNPLSWAYSCPEVRRDYDLIIATSMVDIATLKGLIPSLASTPTVVYFHENQFAYPASSHQKSQLEAQMVGVYSALAADKVLFNSGFNQDSFLSGLSALLKRLPDYVPADLQAMIAEKSVVLPVPLANELFVSQDLNENTALTIVWNHRWEYDKGPDRLLSFLQLLSGSLSIKFHILGQRFRTKPAYFEEIENLLVSRNWLGHLGYIESDQEYRELLSRADIVLSTAIHDFQGLSIMEAVACGCVPLVPDRLAYKELFEAVYRYSEGCSERDEAEALAKVVEEFALNRQSLPKVPSLSAFRWDVLGPEYQSIFEAVIK